MGKKRNDKRGHGREESSDDDMSMASAAASTVADDIDESELVLDTMEMLAEKRAATREGALAKLKKMMEKRPLTDELNNQLETLGMYLSASIKKGSSKEKVLAMLVLEILVLTAGEDANPVYQDYKAQLSDIIKKASSNKTGGVVPACCRALSMACFICAEEDTDTKEYIALMSTTFSAKTTGDDGRVGAIDAWGLLMTTLPTNYVIREMFPRDLPRLIQLLDHDNVEVRMAAGEGIAMLYNSYYSADSVPEEAKHVNSLKFDDLAEKLEQLAKDCSKRRAKVDRAKQRSVFRDVVDTVIDGIYPVDAIKIHGMPTDFEDWHQICQLQALKECLSSGFHKHCEENSLVRDILGLGPAPVAGGPRVRMNKQHLEAMSKARTQHRAKQAQRKANSANLCEVYE
eukprot:GFYU01002700.1.p1 GENE.GFYU01002700.1~~GFYU01002700.1.p1  ORF type:complete len:421 (-),score=106.83 GFYU01002700.1:186-1388(-)